MCEFVYVCFDELLRMGIEREGCLCACVFMVCVAWWLDACVCDARFEMVMLSCCAMRVLALKIGCVLCVGKLSLWLCSC